MVVTLFGKVTDVRAVWFIKAMAAMAVTEGGMVRVVNDQSPPMRVVFELFVYQSPFS